MGRQRTVDDANFWRSRAISECTQEDKATLLYLLTSPSSNVIGVYEIVLRVAAAEMGWSADQLLPVLRRLQTDDLILYDEASCFVWVKIWWEHNSAKMAVSPKLRERTFAQIGKIPAEWRKGFVDDFLARLPPDLCKALNLHVPRLSSFALEVGNSLTVDNRVSDTVSGIADANNKAIHIKNTMDPTQFAGGAASGRRNVLPQNYRDGEAAAASVYSSQRNAAASSWRPLSDVAQHELAKIRAMRGPKPLMEKPDA